MVTTVQEWQGQSMLGREPLSYPPRVMEREEPEIMPKFLEWKTGLMGESQLRRGRGQWQGLFWHVYRVLFSCRGVGRIEKF